MVLLSEIAVLIMMVEQTIFLFSCRSCSEVNDNGVSVRANVKGEDALRTREHFYSMIVAPGASASCKFDDRNNV